MSQLEQAIYTSARTAEGDGYQLVGKSPGVLDIDAQALCVWCPSHDALAVDASKRSINFFQLPSGVFCVSQTVAAGQEYSGRTGSRIYTHCLLVTSDVLARFSNDPFALLNAALCTGEMEPQDVIPRCMSPLRLLGKASAVNRNAIEGFCRQHDAAGLTRLVAALLDSPRLALRGAECCEKAFAAALACIPVECRPEFSFTTGLKHSPRRPFRLMPAGDADPAHLQRRFKIDCTTLGVDGASFQRSPSLWAALIGKLLDAGNLSGIAAVMIPPRTGLTLAALDGLAARIGPAIAPELEADSSQKMTVAHAHASHRRNEERESPGVAMAFAERSTTNSTLPPEQIEKLESLDDAVFEAIAGKPGSLEQLQKLWPAIRTEVDAESLEESRVQYLEYAMRVWNQQGDIERAPAKTMAALDVLCVILDT